MNRGRSHRYQMRRRPVEVEIEVAAGGRTIDQCRRARRRIGGDIKRNIPTLPHQSYRMIGCHVVQDYGECAIVMVGFFFFSKFCAPFSFPISVLYVTCICYVLGSFYLY